MSQMSQCRKCRKCRNTVAATIAGLNHRYTHGHPTDDLLHAGILVHAFDGADGIDLRPTPDFWRPCPTTLWCSSYQRWSLSLTNRRLHGRLFEDFGGGGFVLSPHVLNGASDLKCGFAFDAGTMGIEDGCPAKECIRRPGSDTSSSTLDLVTGFCHWSGGEMGSLLQQHEQQIAAQNMQCGSNDGFSAPRGCYNEIVIEADQWVPKLPHVIEAVLFPKHADAATKARARAVYRAFQEEYGEAVAATPLVSYDPLGKPDAPFVLAGPGH